MRSFDRPKRYHCRRLRVLLHCRRRSCQGGGSAGRQGWDPVGTTPVFPDVILIYCIKSMQGEPLLDRQGCCLVSSPEERCAKVRYSQDYLLKQLLAIDGQIAMQNGEKVGHYPRIQETKSEEVELLHTEFTVTEIGVAANKVSKKV